VTATVLERARAGDAAAFGELMAPHRPALHRHCYRMLGSLTDADDALQETLIAAWQALPGFRELSSVRTWLYRIATNRCLNTLRGAQRRPAAPQPPFPPPEPSRLGEITWLQPYPDASVPALERESVELAFVAALQRLPPRQTAVLLLREVLAFSTAEAAEMLGMTPVAVKAALQRARSQVGRAASGAADPVLALRRARSQVDRAAPASGSALALQRARSQVDRAAPASRAADAALARRFAAALTDGDIDGVLRLLTDDAWLAMPPAPHEYHGRAAVGAFLAASAAWRGPGRLRLVPTSANGQQAFVEYHLPDPVGIIVLTCSGNGIRGVTRFLDDRLAARFAPADP
jgi:RNA polymerase sigma factor (sigma-70 family)